MNIQEFKKLSKEVMQEAERLKAFSNSFSERQRMIEIYEDITGSKFEQGDNLELTLARINTFRKRDNKPTII